jgi:Flp pilus assembly protein TadG
METFIRQHRVVLAPQRGTIAIMAVMALLVITSLYGMALDLGRVYNRRLEFDTVARAAVLAAAQQLNGTAAGIDKAVAEARVAVAGMRYDANRSTVEWRDDVLSFGTAPDGGWKDSATARTDAARMWFVQADTAKLDAPQNSIGLLVMHWLTPALSTAPVTATAVAGRASIDVDPLAVCAMSSVPAAARANPGPPANVELVEYGFRRGVGYDLMQLNPNGVAPVNFVVNPFALPGQPGAPAGALAAAVGPYACSGQLAMPGLSGGRITVAQPFPLASLYRQLNSRMNVYDGAVCTAATAPPDRNIKSYAYDLPVPWMTLVPDQQGALASIAGGRRWTIADPLPAPTTNVARQYGTLWAYARPAPFSSYAPNVDEPTGGYTPFASSDWPTLYAPGAPTPKSYPSGTATPYVSSSSTYAQAPPTGVRGIANRRVLRVPLLACPVGAGGSATVLGIGKFLLTAPATGTSVYAEFGGMAPEHTLAGTVELYR